MSDNNDQDRCTSVSSKFGFCDQCRAMHSCQQSSGDSNTDIEEVLTSLRNTVAFSSRDWSLCKEDVWIYGILLGWDECANNFGFSDEVCARMERLHSVVERVLFEHQLPSPIVPDESVASSVDQRLTRLEERVNKLTQRLGFVAYGL
jgi:hypothetical protein